MHRVQPRHLRRLERHRRVGAQLRPFCAGEDAIRRNFRAGALLHAVCPYPPLRAAFSSRPVCRVRSPSTASTSASGIAARVQHHEQMVEEVGGFGDHPAAILGDRGDGDFDRFLAKLFGAMRDALVEQRAGIGGPGLGLGPVADALFQVVNGEWRHKDFAAVPLPRSLASLHAGGEWPRRMRLRPIFHGAAPKIRINGWPLRLDFWFDFASTYSYPAAMRIGALAAKAGVEVRFRPFLLGPIFKAQGWDTSPFNLYPAKGRHMWRDLERICAELSLAVPAAGAVSATEPAGGAGRAGWASWRRRGAMDFCVAVFRTEFADGQPIGEPATMRAILADLKVDPATTMAAAQSDAKSRRRFAIANRGSAAPGDFRRADFHDGGRRIVLGKRPA